MSLAEHFEDAASDALQPKTILVVDDSRAQRRLVAVHLDRLGYHVIEAGSGEEALQLAQRDAPDMVISDWMMPGMSGLEFCKAYRAAHAERYSYFILLTSKSEKGEIAQGLDVGADDFLTKPFHPTELRARIQAGQRILRMQRELHDKNHMVSSALDEIKRLYEALDGDLIEARKLQQSLVPERFVRVEGADISLMLNPAGRVGGDLVGSYSVSDHEVGFFSLDVSGHGVASALLTARLAGHLSGTSPTQNAAVRHGPDGFELRRPAEAVRALNELILGEIETEHYFTILLAHADLKSGRVEICQAGHPHPLVQRKGGEIEFPGSGGLPVGLIFGADYDGFAVQMQPGDRLFLGSDGITECENAAGEMLENEGLADMLHGLAGLKGPRLLEALAWDLSAHNGDKDFADDVSGVLFEFHGLENGPSA
ncbi:MAG: fused response regulator/phosphatase [Pseudomonadota bacterium]